MYKRQGDLISAVAGERIVGKSLDEAVAGMRGPEGEPVTVTVLSPGEFSRDIEVTRRIVQGRAVRHSVEDGIGYIQIETFNNENLTRDTERALDDLEDQLGGDIPALVIDLRGNRGGLLTQSVSISGLFLDGGEVLSCLLYTSPSPRD